MYWDELKNKTVGIWGMGKEGLAAKDAVTRYTTPLRIIEINEENLENLNTCDIVIKSPGVSLYRTEIEEAKNRGVRFTSGTNLFLANHNSNQKIIAITGTKGKSTTSSLLAHTLKELGQNVILGGNIGVPLLELLDKPADIIVAELSSYQCADLKGNIDIAILVNLYPEHLPWHGTHERYYLDKINMIKQAKVCFFNWLDKRTKELIQDESAKFFNTEFIDLPDFPLKGHHNHENAFAVLEVINELGLDKKRAIKAFKTFKPLPHRLEIVCIKNDITFVDDSISTTPETAIAALEAFKEKPLTLIAGGQDRGQDYTDLIAYIKAHDIKLVTLPDTGSRLSDLTNTPHTLNMKDAVAQAVQLTPANGIIILSPAAPSYNMYKSFEERGNDFKKQTLVSCSPHLRDSKMR